MRILGIDPGTGKLGFGIIDQTGNRLKCLTYGCVTTPAHTPLPVRLVTIFNEISELIKIHQPDKMAVEKLFFARNVTTVMSVGEARGVVMLTAALNKLPVDEFTPLQVKQAITGYGKAEKGQIQKMVRCILGLETIPRPDDAADALAVAITSATASNYPMPKN